MYLFLAESANFSAIPLKIALFIGSGYIGRSILQFPQQADSGSTVHYGQYVLATYSSNDGINIHVSETLALSHDGWPF